ncbi:MAG: NUDIX hydrolase [Pseudomonadales bacterium]
MKHYVTGFLFSVDRCRVALIEKLNPQWQRGLHNGIGGKIEPGESALQAMVREFAEETGVVTQASDWYAFARVHRPGVYEVEMFAAFDDSIDQVRTVEREQVRIFAVDALPKALIPNLAWLIPMALDLEIDTANPVLITERAEPRLKA